MSDIIIKKEQEGDVFDFYEESSEDSTIQVVRRNASANKANRRTRRSATTKPSSDVRKMARVSDEYDDYEPEEPPAHAPMRTEVSFREPKKPPMNMPQHKLNDNLFEVFTNPDKKRVEVEPSEEDPDESVNMDYPSGDYDHPSHDGGGGFNDHSPDFDEDTGEQPSTGFDTIDDEKQDYLYKFYRLQSKGVPLSKKFNMHSNIAEMRSEYNRIKRDAEVNSSIRFSRRMLMACVTGIEFLNKRYDPFDVKLDGWSESVMENVEDYDNVFERLHDKYSSRVSMAPELELLLSLAGSAFMFHLTNNMFNSMPNLKDIAKQNPDILKNMMQTMAAATAAQQPPPTQEVRQNRGAPTTNKSPPASDRATETGQGGGFREMNPPMFDMSSIMNLIQPPPAVAPAAMTFKPVGNYPVASRTTDIGLANTNANNAPFNKSYVANKNDWESPSEVSSSDNEASLSSFNQSKDQQAKTISFSEMTVGGSKIRRNRKNKIQSTASNTISI